MYEMHWQKKYSGCLEGCPSNGAPDLGDLDLGIDFLLVAGCYPPSPPPTTRTLQATIDATSLSTG